MTQQPANPFVTLFTGARTDPAKQREWQLTTHADTQGKLHPGAAAFFAQRNLVLFYRDMTNAKPNSPTFQIYDGSTPIAALWPKRPRAGQTEQDVKGKFQGKFSLPPKWTGNAGDYSWLADHAKRTPDGKVFTGIVIGAYPTPKQYGVQHGVTLWSIAEDINDAFTSQLNAPPGTDPLPPATPADPTPAGATAPHPDDPDDEVPF